MKKRLRAFQCLLCVGILCVVGATNAADDVSGQSKPSGAAAEKPLDYIAIVDGEKISIADYISALRSGMKKRFYHGKIPEDEQKKFRKDVAEKMVERFLLIREAKRQGIQPDADAVEKAVARYDAQFKDNPDWPAARDSVLPRVREKLEGDSLVMRLEEKVRTVPQPNDAELKAFYGSNANLFTTPERVRVSIILLRVDPSSPSEVWRQASEEAADIVERIRKGADFSELARIHSSDDSAQNGGDMGYIHAGMLGEHAQKVLDIMEPGEVSSPVVLLEGVAIFRLADRVTAKLNPLSDVKERAAKLYVRENGEKAWDALKTKLRSAAKIEMNEAPWQ